MPAVTRHCDDACDELVVDSLGQTRLPVHPGYSATPATYSRVMMGRVAVCVLSFAATVFAVVGQAVPYAYLQTDTSDINMPGATRGTKVAVWTVTQVYEWEDYNAYVASYLGNAAMQATAVLAAFFAFASFAVSIALACVWCCQERARRVEEAENLELQWKYGANVGSEAGQEMPSFNETGSSSTPSAPYARVTSAMAGDVAQVPLEVHEKKRRVVTCVLGAVTFGLLIIAGIFALVTMSLMARDNADFNKLMDAGDLLPSLGISLRDWKVRAGLPLFVVCVALAIAAFVVVAIPSLTHVHFCCAPAMPRCALVVVVSAAEAARRAAVKPTLNSMPRSDKATQTLYYAG